VKQALLDAKNLARENSAVKERSWAMQEWDRAKIKEMNEDSGYNVFKEIDGEVPEPVVFTGWNREFGLGEEVRFVVVGDIFEEGGDYIKLKKGKVTGYVDKQGFEIQSGKRKFIVPEEEIYED
jgi:hypothetical protein